MLGCPLQGEKRGKMWIIEKMETTGIIEGLYRDILLLLHGNLHISMSLPLADHQYVEETPRKNEGLGVDDPGIKCATLARTICVSQRFGSLFGVPFCGVHCLAM